MSYLVKFNFITSYLAFRGSIPTNSYQPQKYTMYCRKNLLYSHVTFLYYPTARYHLLFICSLLQWYFSSLDYATILDNSILNNTTNGNTHKPKASFVAIEVTKTTQSVHNPRGRHARVLIRMKVQFLDTRTHKHIILHSLRILEYMFEIRSKL